MKFSQEVSVSTQKRKNHSSKAISQWSPITAVPNFHNSLHVFEHIDESFFFFDRNLCLLYLNKKGSFILEKAYGTRLEVGQCVLEKLPLERRPAFLELMNTVLDGQPIEYEYHVPSSGVWLHCKYFPNSNADGKIDGLYGVVKDITAQKEVSRLTKTAESIQKDLFQSRLLFEQFMQNSPLIAWLTDARGTMRYMNPVFLKTYGFTEADFGKSIYELFPAQLAVDYHMNNQQVLKTGEAIECIERGLKSNGDEQVLKIYKFQLVLNNEAMVGGWGVDITDQMELQEKLIKSVERHEYVNEATSDAIYDWDFATGNLYRSDRFEELFSFTDKKVSLRQRLKFIHPEDLQEFKRVVFSSIRNKAVNKWQVEYRVRLASGEYRNVLDKAFLIRNKQKVVRVIGALQDITPQKELQKKIINQEKRNKRELIKSIIETQEKERRQLSVELHDNVNQMLASCKLMLEVAIENSSNSKMLTEKTYQSIQTVINEIRRISHDLNPSAIIDVGLVEAIEQLIEKINVSGKIKIIFSPDKRRYKDYLDDEDKIAIFRIVQEQLNNILKHANATTVVIRLEVVEGLVRLCIKDDGIGFDLAKCKKGLGLRNIYNRVEYYGGTINITSGSGRGCEMCLTLRIKSIAETPQLKIA